MKVDFTKLVRSKGSASGLKSIFLTGSNESYLDYCRYELIKIYRAHFPNLDVEKCPCDMVLKQPEKAQAQSDLFTKGAHRLVVIEDPSDQLTPFMANFLKQDPKGATLILSCAVSSKAKKLKAMCQASPDSAYVNCYLNTPQEKKSYLDTLLKTHNLRFDAEAAAYAHYILESAPEILAENCLKLSLYKADQTPVSLVDFKNCDARPGETRLDKLVAAVGDRCAKTAFTSYQQIQQADFEDIYVLRTLSAHFSKLLDLKAKMVGGMSAQHAMNAMRPPIFFKSHDMFKRHLQKWEASAVVEVLKALRQAELNLKTGRPMGFMMDLCALFDAAP